MRQAMYKSFPDDMVVSENDEQEATLRKKGYVTCDEILGINEFANKKQPQTETVNKSVKIDAEPSASVGIDLDGDDKVDVRVNIHEGAASAAIAGPASVPEKQTPKRGRPSKRR